MNNQVNLEKLIKNIQLNIEQGEQVPKLLLHSCCAPCSTYVLEYLSDYFEIIVYYYNPNIFPQEEYQKRAEEQQYLIHKMQAKHPITCIVGDYESELFYDIVKGLENEPECGIRCDKCYELRLRKTRDLANVLGVDYFTTTLTISPLKKADKLNEIGLQLAKDCDVNYLVSDFKKKNGYKRSTEISKEYQLYRQDFCGCIYSKLERDKRKNVWRKN
ncbi:MAG: epoxyqueuosine reductase QueH [Eubacteriales bacterium]